MQGAHFPQGNYSISISNVTCNGTESTLSKCNNITGQIDCGHQQEAGVVCAGCNNGDVRLVNGTNSTSGQVQVCVMQQWTTICMDTWDQPDAQVVCRQLGHSVYGQCSQIVHNYRDIIMNK